MQDREPTAQDYLGYLQELYAATHGVPLKDGVVQIAQTVLEATAEELKDELWLVSGGSEPLQYLQETAGEGYGVRADSGLLTPVIERALGSLDSEERKQVEAIPIGLIHQAIFNAAACPAPAGGQVVVISYSLIRGLNIAMRNLMGVIGRVFGYVESSADEQQNEIINFFNTLRRELLLDVEAEYDLTKTVSKMSVVPGFSGLLAFDMSMTQQSFVILHEWGHVLLGHLSPENLQGSHPSDDERADVKYFTMRRSDEFDADAWAAERLKPASGDAVDEASVLASVATYFHILYLCEEFFAGEAKDQGTHPPALERWNRLMKNVYGVGSVEHVPQLHDVSRLCHELVARKSFILSTL